MTPTWGLDVDPDPDLDVDPNPLLVGQHGARLSFFTSETGSGSSLYHLAVATLRTIWL